jgi:NADH-quinone oxidoreductase subunit K
MMIPLEHFLIFAAALFVIGLCGTLVRRNLVGILMSIELMLNAVNINLVAFSRSTSVDPVTGQVFAIFVIALAAAAVAVGLAIAIALYRVRKSVWADEINILKW